MDAGYRVRNWEPRGLDVESLRRSFSERLTYAIGKDKEAATRRDWFHAMALSLRERMVDRWVETTQAVYEQDVKRVYYLSLEFLIGRLLMSSMANLGILAECRQALAQLGLSLDEVMMAEPDAALGNGGLGRLAACFMDSLATQGLPGYGYGIRYEFGLFEQHLEQGWQVEYPEQWLQFGNPWEFPRPEVSYPIQFYGRVEQERINGEIHHRWVDGESVVAMAFDTPVVGYGGRCINTLRLWQARATSEINLGLFAMGDYLRAVERKVLSENLSRVLYPNDTTETGRELRLRQEYFFTSASLQDVLRRFLRTHDDFSRLSDYAAVQLNDTHPAIGIAEMMRLLVDLHRVPWDKAWDITTRTFSYTNHTLLPEALESWPVGMFERVLPRHLMIIYEINDRFLKASRARREGDVARLARISLIDERGERRVRMGNLAFIGSHHINGVSALHTDMMKKTVFADLNAEFPGRILNKTNGITPRRWLLEANPALSRLITSRIGPTWVNNLDQLQRLKPYADDAMFRDEFRQAKRDNKARLAAYIARQVGVEVSVDSLFDVQVKRIHEYKRQLLNVLQTIALWDAIRSNPDLDWVPVTKIFAGKAAPSYATAKLIIKLVNDIADVINNDPLVGNKLKVVFLPNYSVTAAEMIIPAADLSQQISTAGLEASGTGNMKLALNGALTIGTLDGANVEIREAVGEENIFIFGLTADQVVNLHRQGNYNARQVIAKSPRLSRALEMMRDGRFSPDDPYRYHSLWHALTEGRDHFLVTADFDDYWLTWMHAADLYRDQEAWSAKAVINTASMGWFSSDRTVLEYAREIWNVRPLEPFGSEAR